MYVRFVTPLRDPATGAETGFFRARWYLNEIGCPEWIQAELDHQFGWFGDHLAVPKRLCRPSWRRGSLRGVCWFRPEATECISRARYCAWLINEGGLPVRLLRLHAPREVIWRDDLQLVVRPDATTPRAFAGAMSVAA